MYSTIIRGWVMYSLGLMILFGITGCGGGSGGVGGTAANNSSATLMTIEVSPATQSMAIGISRQFTATGVYSDNSRQDLTSTVTWASSDTSKVTVSTTGLATAQAGGLATITATTGSISGKAVLTVAPALLVSIQLNPSNSSIAVGTTQKFTAIGVYDDASTQDISDTAAWSSTNVGTATVDAHGLATALAAGSTVVTASFGGKSGTASLTVTSATLSSISVTPATPSIAAGTSRQFSATGIFSDNSRQDLTSTVVWSSSSTAVASIASSGLATGVGIGSTTITAAFAGISAATTLTVSPATLVAIDVSPVNPKIALGTTQQLAATGRYSDNSVRDLTADATWTSSTITVATVSNAVGFSGTVTPVFSGTSTIAAAFGSITGSTTVTVTAATLTTIDLIPGVVTIAKGTVQQFTSVGTYSDGSTQDLTAASTWSSSDPAVATVSNASTSKGQVSSIAAGSVLITATFGGRSGSATLTVTAATLTAIEVTPTDPTLPKGLSQQFNATGIFSDASTQDLTGSVTWISTNPTVAVISNVATSSGQASGLAAGTTVILAALGGVSGSSTLTVSSATLVAIDVTPITPTIAKGTALQFTATGTYSDSSTQDLTTLASWSSSSEAVAVISNASNLHGLATAVAAGSSTVTAAVGSVSGSTVVTVSAANLVSIAVTPVSQTLSKGLTQQYTAIGTFDDANTQDLSGQVVWRSSNTGIASISNLNGTKGLATAIAAGQTTISATLLGITSNGATLTVSSATLQSIAITPVAPSIALKTNQQFTAMGTYSDATVRDITKFVTWNSSSTAVATISNAGNTRGLATPVGSGQTTIRASFGGVSTTTTLTVNTSTLVSITITPANQSIAKGATLQFTATGTFSNASTQDLTKLVSWASSTKNVANVSNSKSNKGLSKGLNIGTTTISATTAGVSGTTSLTVQ